MPGVGVAVAIGFLKGRNDMSHVTATGTSVDAGAVVLALAIPVDQAWRGLLIVVGRCTAGTDVGKMTSWIADPAVENIGGTSSLVKTPSTSFACSTGLDASTCAISVSDPLDSVLATAAAIAGIVPNQWSWKADLYYGEV